MAHRRYKHDPVPRWIEEGKGQGEGANYRPWLGPREGGQLGNVHRILGHTTGRIHVLFGGNERSLFYLLDWSDSVLDIREQYPMDRDVTSALAEELGIRHPRIIGTKFVYVMTTDVLATVATDAGVVHHAFDCKPQSELDKPRVRELLTIHQEYWKAQHVVWTPVIEKSIHTDTVMNLRWIHPRRSAEFLPTGGRDLGDLLSSLGAHLRNHPEQGVAASCRCHDLQEGVPPGTSLAIVRHALATKHWRFNVTERLDLSRPIAGLSIPPN